MRTLKISLIATVIATVANFRAGKVGLMRRGN
jgi:hypothetical protein